MRWITSTTLAIACSLSIGCSPYARVYRQDGSALDARITGSDRSQLFLALPDDETTTIDRDDIEDIDHPGNVAMLVGLPNTVLGGVCAVISVFTLPAAIEQGWPDDNSDDLGAAPVATLFGVIAALSLAVGLPPFLWGSRQWFDSTGNALPPESPSLRLSVGPGGVLIRF